MLIEPRIEIVIEGCGQIYMAQTITRLSIIGVTSIVVVLELGCPELEKQSTTMPKWPCSSFACS